MYTRKSTEDGLEQEFNSLDAQREACGAFIASQVGLGWRLVPDRYDDGGMSGGTMERPALQRLLQDIRDTKVDVVVVYKIDRLTRSLADFAKIVEVFDGNGVSFVSVTQQFNTTTSMGRLTLNVLLSFAQFEREVTAERIRDKIAASRKKGMWMGGRVPFGYAVVDKKLLVEPQTATIVRHVFCRLLELGSVGALLDELQEQYANSATCPGAGQARMDQRLLQRGPLTYLLTNPLYVGKVKHHGAFHDGEHEPIVDRELFDRVQDQLSRRSTEHCRRRNGSANLLVGLLFDETGDRLVATSASSHGRFYRYYMSARLKDRDGSNKGDGWRLGATEIEGVVIRELRQQLTDQTLLAGWISTLASAAHISAGLESANSIAVRFGSPMPPYEKRRLLLSLLDRVVVAPGKICMALVPANLVRLIVGGHRQLRDDKQPAETENDDSSKSDVHVIKRSMVLAKRAIGTRIVIDGEEGGEPCSDLTDLVSRSHYFLDRLTDGSCTSIKEVAARLNMHPADISRVLPLAFLAPSIVERIPKGSQPASLTPAYLARAVDLPPAWTAQAELLIH